MQKPRHGREDKRFIDLLVGEEKKTHQRVVLVNQYVNEDVLNVRPGNLKIEPAVITVNKQYHGMQKGNTWGKRKLGQRGKGGTHNPRKGTHWKAKGLHKLSSNVIASEVDTTCPPLHYQEPAASTVVALASIHGSGSVWLRHLIQQATRIYTGSVDQDRQLKRKDFLAQHVSNGSVIVVQTSDDMGTGGDLYGKAILLVRDPEDTLVADFHRTRSEGKSHVGVVPVKSFLSRRWTKFVQTRIIRWRLFYESWLTFDGPILVIEYKDLQRDPMWELARLLTFLEIPDVTLHCAMREMEGNFHRVYNRQLYAGVLSPYLKALVRRHEEPVYRKAGLNL
ncbi:Sulfotransfer_1 domain-containing protein [Lamellibrachia satsuma]|nr:Sulfotransfer_1 domain-containing protein [Lamellibrachia satsuma]